MLVHHKKMLGIYESELDDLGKDSVINESEGQIIMDSSHNEHMDDLIDQHDLSSSIMHCFDDI